MLGADLVSWRTRNGYRQEDLMRELDVKSRQTISSWERPEHVVPRLVELALIALEHAPSCRRIAGKKLALHMRISLQER